MKKKILPIIIAIGLILLVIAGIFGMRLIKKYTPSKELADISALFGVEDTNVALILNEELQETQGLFVDGQTYLPIEWVNENLNERFYWDGVDKMLVYTLPNSIVYADHETMGSTGKPLLWVTDAGVYLSIGMVANYTDIRIAAYDTEDIKRLYINNTWGSEQAAVVAKAGKVREKGGIKSPIITELTVDTPVAILETLDKWSKVRTVDGYIGYAENRRLKDFHEEIATSAFEAPVYTSISLGKEVCLAWHQVTNMESNASLETVLANTKGVNVISPTWFALNDNEGGYKSLASKDYVDKAHDMGIQVWALIDNFSKDVNTEVMMAATSVRKKLINSLMKDVETYGIDGLNLDIEGIKEEAGVHYVQFIRELSIACRKNGIILSVDNYVPIVYNQFYNRKEQGIVADYVIIMGYDEHYAGGEAGSVASIDYVKNGIINTLADVPKEKVINGIPFFTRVWTEGADGTSSTAMGISKARNWVSENNVELYWQEELGQYYGEHDGDEGKQQIWMEDERSLALKMDLIRENQLAGVACWKLGFEPAEIWDVINPQ